MNYYHLGFLLFSLILPLIIPKKQFSKLVNGQKPDYVDGGLREGTKQRISDVSVLVNFIKNVWRNKYLRFEVILSA